MRSNKCSARILSIAGGLHNALLQGKGTRLRHRGHLHQEPAAVGGQAADGRRLSLLFVSTRRGSTFRSWSRTIPISSILPRAMTPSGKSPSSPSPRKCGGCDRLGVKFLVTHPGAHTGAGRDCRHRAADPGVQRHHARASRCGGGQRHVVPGDHRRPGNVPRLHVRATRHDAGGQCRIPSALPICVDTAHLLASGYDITTEAGHAKGDR